MKRLVIGLSVLFVLFLVGCGGQTLYMCADGTVGGSQIPEAGKDLIYVCPDGRETDNIAKCTFHQELIISKKDAEIKSLNFVNGYVRASGWQATLINVYPDEGNFYGQIVVSKNGENSYETTVKIDGLKGIVSCEKNCVYTT